VTSRTDRASASWLVTVGIFGSRVTGLLREAALAHFFGTSGVADAWRAALRLPNFIQNLLGEGSLSASFIPIYSELLEEKRHEDAARFAGAALALLAVIAGVTALLGILLAPILVAIVFAGFDPARQATTTSLVRILFPMTALLVVSAWALGVLNSHRRFLLSYAAPMGWNAAMIAAMLAGGIWFGMSLEELVRFLAWGALVGGAIQLLLQLPPALRLVGEFRPSLSLNVIGVREGISNFVPVVTARGAVNLSGYLDYFLAAYLVTGAVAVLGYAQTLYLLPISLFGMAVAASELPELSRERGVDRSRLAGQVGIAMERVAYFLIPSAIGYLLLGDVITSVLFQRGEFGSSAVLVTWAVLGAYALGMPASATSRVLSSAFYALRDTRTPARIAYLRIATSFAVGVALIFPLDTITVGSLSLGPAGLAFGASVGAWLELALLRRALRRSVGAHGIRPAVLVRMVGAVLLAGAAALCGRYFLAEAGPWLAAAGTLIPFAGVYLSTTLLLRAAEPLKGLPFFR